VKFVKPLFSSHFYSKSKDPSYVGSAFAQNIPGKIGEASLAILTGNGPEIVQVPSGVITSPTLLRPFLVWRQPNSLRLLLTVRYVQSS